jgi:Flp pilus assembly protein TadD
MEYTYDNSSTNIRNPELPPARVFWGQRSRDEMGDLWFQLLASNETDRARLNAEISAKMTSEDIVGYETMLKVTPDDAELHDDVALLYMGLGFAANAVRHFQATALLKPESAAAHFNLGTAYAQAGRFDNSIASFREALRLRPDYALARGNLARILLITGSVADALREFQEAVRLDPNNPQNLLGLSEALAARGDYDRAIETIERAIKLPLSEALAREVFAKRAEYLKRK